MFWNNCCHNDNVKNMFLYLWGSKSFLSQASPITAVVWSSCGSFPFLLGKVGRECMEQERSKPVLLVTLWKDLSNLSAYFQGLRYYLHQENALVAQCWVKTHVKPWRNPPIVSLDEQWNTSVGVKFFSSGCLINMTDALVFKC